MNCNYFHPHLYLSPVGWIKLNKKSPLLLIEFMNIFFGFFAQFRFHECHAFPHKCSYKLQIQIYNHMQQNYLFIVILALMCIILVRCPHSMCYMQIKFNWENFIFILSYRSFAVSLCVHMQKIFDCLLNTNIHFHFPQNDKKWWLLLLC
jgi:hypothetical protein